MDVMLESRVWGAKYLSNPFPYILDDITRANEKELNGMKKCFAVNYNKYDQFKNISFKEINEKKTVVEALLEKSKQVEEIMKIDLKK